MGASSTVIRSILSLQLDKITHILLFFIFRCMAHLFSSPNDQPFYSFSASLSFQLIHLFLLYSIYVIFKHISTRCRGMGWEGDERQDLSAMLPFSKCLPTDPSLPSGGTQLLEQSGHVLKSALAGSWSRSLEVDHQCWHSDVEHGSLNCYLNLTPTV